MLLINGGLKTNWKIKNWRQYQIDLGAEADGTGKFLGRCSVRRSPSLPFSHTVESGPCQWAPQGGRRLTPSREAIRSSTVFSNGARKEKLTSRCQCFGNCIWSCTYGPCICPGYASSRRLNDTVAMVWAGRGWPWVWVLAKTAVQSAGTGLMEANYQRTSLGSSGW